MKKNQFVKNYFWSLVQFILNILISFFLTSYVTENIGIESYGFIELSNTIMTYMNIISTALNAFASRYISLEYHQENYKEARLYFNSVIVSNIILSIVFIMFLVPFIFKLDLFLKIPVNFVFDVKILFVLLLINYVFTLLRTAFTVSTFIKNRLDLTYSSNAFSYIIRIITLILLYLIFNPKLYYIAIANDVIK